MVNILDFAITQVNCVELFLVTEEKAKSAPPVLISFAVASAENLVPVTVNV